MHVKRLVGDASGLGLSCSGCGQHLGVLLAMARSGLEGIPTREVPT